MEADQIMVLTAEDRLRDAVARCERLPVLDRSLQRVLELAGREETTVSELVRALESDSSLTANMLRFANSAAFARLHRLRNVRQAVTLLGRRLVRELALDSVAYSFFERAPGNGGSSRGQLHVHSVQVARLASLCAERAGLGTEPAHLAGLLHDCGKLVLPLAFGEAAVDAVAVRHPRGDARARAEREVLGADHAAAGGLLAAASGVADEVVRAVAWHHGAPDGRACPDRITACVQLADAIAGAVSGGELDADAVDRALGVLGLDNGAVDELAMSVGGADLPPGSPLAARASELERLAMVDDLTGLASRRHWLETVRRRLEGGERGSLLLCDLDHFKEVNDRRGHAAGDLVLCEVARIAAHQGLAGRLGGDELAVWVTGEPSAGPAAARTIVEEVRLAFAGPASLGPVTVSVGIAGTPPGPRELSALLDWADRALHEAKRAGRDRSSDALPV